MDSFIAKPDDVDSNQLVLRSMQCRQSDLVAILETQYTLCVASLFVNDVSMKERVCGVAEVICNVTPPPPKKKRGGGEGERKKKERS